jgi:hypothetical protein
MANKQTDDIDQWQKNIDNFLGAAKEAVYVEISNVTGCGPFDGGCFLFALALKRVVDGDIWALTKKGIAQHAIVKVSDDLYCDAGGFGSLSDMIKRIDESEGYQIGINGARPVASSDFEGSPLNPSMPQLEPLDTVVERLAEILRRDGYVEMSARKKLYNRATSFKSSDAVNFLAAMDSFNLEPGEVKTLQARYLDDVELAVKIVDSNDMTR